MALRYSKTRIVSIFLMTLLAICMFAAAANASTLTANIEVTVTDADKDASEVNLSTGIAVVDPNGDTLTNVTDYTLTRASNVYTISGLTTKGEYYISLGDGDTTETIKVTGVTPKATATTKKVKMTWALPANAKSGSIGGVIYESNLTTSAAIASVKIISSVATWTTSTTSGYFKVYVPAGSYSLIVYGKDSTKNRNEVYDLTVKPGQMASPMDQMTNENLLKSATDDPDPALEVKASPAPEFGKDLTINFTDTAKKMTYNRTSVFITTGAAITGTTGSAISLSLYKLTPGAKGKIVIKAAAFSDVGTYNIKLSNGYYRDDESDVSQVIGASTKTKAAALTTTQEASSTTYGAMTLNVNPTSNNSISYVLSNQKITAPFIGAVSPNIVIPKTGATTTTFSALTLSSGSGTISNLNLVNRKYLGVYELTPNNAVAKFKLITLTKTMIKSDLVAPVLASASANSTSSINATDKTVILAFDKNIYQVGTDAAFKKAIKVLKNPATTTGTAIGTYDSGATINVSGKTVTITLSQALPTTYKITIAKGALQNAYAVKNALVTLPGSTVATSTTASALTGFVWAAGTETGTTKAISVPTGTLMYVVGAAGAKTAPNVGELATGYSTLTANTDIEVTSDQHIFIAEIDSTTSNKIVQWVDVPATDVNIK